MQPRHPRGRSEVTGQGEARLPWLAPRALAVGVGRVSNTSLRGGRGKKGTRSPAQPASAIVAHKEK